jgi:Rrf2 family protein
MFNERTRYTLKFMAYLAAVEEDGFKTIDSLSDDLMIPRGYLGKISQELSEAGLLESKKGANGGVKLSDPADEIRVLDVMDHLDALAHNDEKIPETCCVPDLFNDCMVDKWMTEFENNIIGDQSLAELVEVLQSS